MNKPKAFALWGTSAVLTLGVGVVVGWQTTASAVASPKAAAPSTLPFTSNGNGPGGGNSGKGSGNGAGTGAPGKALQVSHELVGAPAPGSPAELTLTVTNANSQPVQLTAVDAAISGVTPKKAGAACSVDDFTVAPYAGPLGVVAANGGTATLTLSLELINKTWNQDDCKEASVAFSYSVNGRQA